MSPFIVRVLKPTDSKLYRKIRLQALQEFPSSYCSSFETQNELPKLGFENSILNEDNTKPILGAFKNEQLLGIVGLNIFENKSADIIQMYVAKRHQGKGIGKQLLESAINYAKGCSGKQIELDVFSPSKRAMELYKRFGFEETKTELTTAGDGQEYLLTTMSLMV